MPHAENDMSGPVTNGDKSQSQFISHLTSYPVVSDGIETFKSNPYGARSLEVAETTYTKLGKPVMPYLETPYSYAAPYIAKADELADKGLGQVDTRFPIVKEDTTTIKDTVVDYAFLPLRLANDGRVYFFKTWDDQYNKTAARNNRGAGISTSILAIISTQLKIAADGVEVIADYFGPKAEEARKKRDSAIESFMDKKDGITQDAKKKKDAYAEDAKKKTNQTKDSFAEKAQEKS